MSTLSALRTAQPLDDVALARLCPAAFAPAPHGSRSERYAYISTAEVIDGLRKEGFLPVSAQERRTRIADRRGYTKHMIRFRHQGQQSVALNGTFPEVVLINSHDGTSQYEIMSGLFRLICLNGMVVSEGHARTVKVPHKGDVVRQVIEGSFEVLDDAQAALKATREWSMIDLKPGEQEAFAEAAHLIRFADADGNVDTPITAQQLLAPRRYEDRGNSLWLTFNRVQENATKGGLSGFRRAPNGERRRVTTREIGSIEGDVKLNRALHALAARMAELKAG